MWEDVRSTLTCRRIDAKKHKIDYSFLSFWAEFYWTFFLFTKFRIKVFQGIEWRYIPQNSSGILKINGLEDEMFFERWNPKP